MVRRLVILVVGLLLLWLACPRGAGGQEGAALPPSPHAFHLPASYLGELPCADCPGMRTILTLAPDSVFFLRRVYREAENGQDKTVSTHGRWRVREDGQVLYLYRRGQREGSFTILAESALRMRDPSDREIVSELNYTLTRMGGTDSIPDRLRLTGYYSYIADTGTFTDCDAARSIRVAQEGANAELEKAYLAVRRPTGEAVLVTLEGTLHWREKMEGKGSERVLVVEKLDRFWSGYRCGDELPIFALEGGEWELVELAGRMVHPTSGSDRPWMRLDAKEKRASGIASCNRFTGGYTLAADSLRFAAAATTRMACPQGVEQEFLAMLGRVTRYRIDGPVLELYGADGLLAKLRLKG